MLLWLLCGFVIFSSVFDVIAQNSSKEICGIKSPGDQYPWLVGFEFPSYDPKPRIECTGALIDRRHVLGKVICFSGISYQRIPKSVRLGPYNTITDENCLFDDYNDGSSNCVEVGVVSIPIEVVIPHPLYDDTKGHLLPNDIEYDIALIRLKEPVTYTDVIRPICLPSSDVTLSTTKDTELFIAGLKLLPYSPTRNENHLETTKYLDPTECKNIVDLEVGLDNICTKNPDNSSSEVSCLRAGGLLMNKKNDRYELVGLLQPKTSCARAKISNNLYAQMIWVRREIDKWLHGCGKRKVKHVELIMNGDATKAGDWPWHVALYRSQKYICGGTLLSKWTVLTAAHCVTVGGMPASPDLFKVILGKYYLIGGEIETQDMDVRSIIVHEQFAARNQLHNDIALMKLKTEAVYNDYVQPACIWTNEVNDRLPNKDMGTVVGWGFDQLEWLSSQLKQANVPKVSNIQCINKNPPFYSKVLSNNMKFCAGWANGTSICNGDSGGGFLMLVPDKANTEVTDALGSWYIRGIVSLSAAVRNTGRCDPYQYAVFTDVANYTTWIVKHLAEELPITD